jgi:hypothetical protein
MKPLLFFLVLYSSGLRRGGKRAQKKGFKSRGKESDKHFIQPANSLDKIFSLTDSGPERYFLKTG